jgi:Trk K+ transport system NAD-binding subunit
MLVVLLDGYDELNENKVLISSVIRKYYSKIYKKIKIIVTIRSEYASFFELNRVFNSPKIIYICPFNKK